LLLLGYFFYPISIIQRDLKNYATQYKEAGIAVSHPKQSCHAVKLH